MEEVARIIGYEAITRQPAAAPSRAGGRRADAPSAPTRLARRFLAARAISEAVTWSFIAREIARLFGGGEPSLVLENPIAAELDCMRPSILPGLIAAAAQQCSARSAPMRALFEIGPVFAGPKPEEQRPR